MTRLATWLALVIVVLPSPAAAQKTLFVEGLAELARTMLTTSADAGRTNAAIDKMAAGLDGWEPPIAPFSGSLIGDETAETPALPLAAYADGFARIVRGEYRDAIVSLRRAAAISIDERSELSAAGRLAREGRHVEAERMLRAIVTARPESGVAHWWLGRVYENLNRIADARHEYERVVAVAMTGRASILAAIGRLAHGEGNFARATEAFTERLRLTPNDAVAHKDLALIHLEQDRTEAALEEFGAVVALEPRDAEAHAAVGRIRLDAGRHAEAIPAFRRALDLRPTLHEARYALALALKQIGGREAEAAREMELFEHARRESTEERRRTMAAEAQRQEEARQGQAR